LEFSKENGAGAISIIATLIAPAAYSVYRDYYWAGLSGGRIKLLNKSFHWLFGDRTIKLEGCGYAF